MSGNVNPKEWKHPRRTVGSRAKSFLARRMGQKLLANRDNAVGVPLKRVARTIGQQRRNRTRISNAREFVNAFLRARIRVELLFRDFREYTLNRALPGNRLAAGASPWGRRAREGGKLVLNPGVFSGENVGR